jgi:hypothetical protein
MTKTADVVKTAVTSVVKKTAVARTVDATHPAVNRAGAKDGQPPPALQLKLASSTSSENFDVSKTLTKVVRPQVVLLRKGQEAALNCELEGLFRDDLGAQKSLAMSGQDERAIPKSRGSQRSPKLRTSRRNDLRSFQNRRLQ